MHEISAETKKGYFIELNIIFSEHMEIKEKYCIRLRIKLNIVYVLNENYHFYTFQIL